MDFITNRIAIGDRHEAADLNLLLEFKIEAVLNLAYDLDISYYNKVPPPHYKFKIEYQKVGLIDGHGNQPTTLISAVYMLNQLLERHQKVLVHCHEGVSRSSAIVTTYLTHKRGIRFDEAFEFVKSKRPSVNPNPALVAIARSLPNLFEIFD